MFRSRFLILAWLMGLMGTTLMAQGPETAALLSLPNPQLKKDRLAQQKLLDLVQPYVIDSVLKEDICTQRGMPRALVNQEVRHWKAIKPVKQKLVGITVKDNKTYVGSVPTNGGIWRERDVCFHLTSHLPKYIDLISHGFDRQDASGRDLKSKKYVDPPFPCPDSLLFEGNCLDVELECTPKINLRRNRLNDRFYPCKVSSSMLTHPNMGTAHLPLGVYGPFVSDCMHNCKPEIHPYEWIWWLNLDTTSALRKDWMIGLLNDDTRRFTNWVDSPRRGGISLPFACQPGQDLSISLDLLVWDEFLPIEDAHLPANPATKVTPKVEELTFDLPGGGKAHLKTSIPVEDGLRLWVTGLQKDPSSGLLLGQLHLAVAVKNLFTARVVFDGEAQ
ncbi:MAG: hypothetical protein H6581_04650 [Bacteroidia bacterium]|nr:hypothetical protein [Bacteroidia bacterium]